MSEYDKFRDEEENDIFSKSVKAGKRTYFFDVRATQRNDYYITITERKKIFDDDGGFQVEKHKIFLYKEDFEKFFEALDETIGFIKKSKRKRSFDNSADEDL